MLEGVLALGDDLAQVSGRTGVHRDDASQRRVEVRPEVEGAVDRGDVLVRRVAGVEQRAHGRRVDAGVEIRDVDAGLGVRAAGHGQHEQPAVVRDLRIERPLRLVRRREHEHVVGRIGADAVVAQLLVDVRGVVRRVRGRLRVATVEEAGVVPRPRGADELAPRDAVRQRLARRHAPDRPRPPVGAGVARRDRRELAALAHLDGGQRGRAVLAEAVGIDEDRPLPRRVARRPQDVLVLEARVAELEPAVAPAPRRAGSRVVPELRQPRPDRVAAGHAAEDRGGQLVLRADPRTRRGRVAVLEGPVRVGDRRAVVVVDQVRRRGRRVGEPGHARHRTVRAA